MGRPLWGAFGFGLTRHAGGGGVGAAGAVVGGGGTKETASARAARVWVRRPRFACDPAALLWRATATACCARSGCRVESELNGEAGSGTRTAGGTATGTCSGALKSTAERQRKPALTAAATRADRRNAFAVSTEVTV